ncbi:GIY-YIG nuclease family protein [Sediminibacterium sp.]|uniref:GIY-YIG nuclease family protein n=1 Tax=Sediminibacterium sp. TaxID=1917865 RepID=UPI0025EA81CA|nr:GIY-YIG nuclease family protein [Sediminibacterium sp.]MBW0177637.1 GIY-YIG nuclease family protein [Sediminibacterium sp.]
MYKPGYVYILTNASKTMLYVGVTSNLPQRIWRHKQKTYHNSYTAKYNIHELIYYEFYTSIEEAIKREKEIKGWKRSKKNALINTKNPKWETL